MQNRFIQLGRQEFYTQRDQQNKINKLKTLCNVNDDKKKDTSNLCREARCTTKCVLFWDNFLFLNDWVRLFFFS